MIIPFLPYYACIFGLHVYTHIYCTGSTSRANNGWYLLLTYAPLPHRCSPSGSPRRGYQSCQFPVITAAQ